MSKYADFLVEIQTEELPPKALRSLAESFYHEIKKRLEENKLSFSDAAYFATPRRLAVSVNDLLIKQADSEIEKRGPAWQAAFDAHNQPTPACMGFAKTCGTTPDQLITIENKQGKWVGFRQMVSGKSAKELIPTVVQQALAALPIPKRMRWGAGTAEFVRPVHHIILLLGKDIIQAEILGVRTGNQTPGHRFLCKKLLTIKQPKDYEKVLEKGFVRVDFEKRKKIIRDNLNAINIQAARVLIDEDLLEEVTGLVEWPVVMQGTFDREFLRVPQEALISAMQDHQRYFPVVDAQQKLQPYFVMISNLATKNYKQIVAGNERVLRARLSDAAFFFDTDKKTKLVDHLEKLNHVTYQAKLGSLGDKSQRLKSLMAHLAQSLKLNVSDAERAGLLAKTDLVTTLVREFPELQGIAGYYYALNDHEKPDVAKAIKEHYQPRVNARSSLRAPLLFAGRGNPESAGSPRPNASRPRDDASAESLPLRYSGDQLPDSSLGCALALADRLDILVGIFGIQLIPTGDKDPFGLRRAALGVLRILIEKKLNLDMLSLLDFTAKQFQSSLPNKNVVQDVWQFMLDRLKPWYAEQGINTDVFMSVAALNITKPYDIHCRIQAVQSFKRLTDATALSVANKRVSNILTQYGRDIHQQEVNAQLFEHDSERELMKQLNDCAIAMKTLVEHEEYQAILTQLAQLRIPVDQFFDHVLVMTDDEQRRENRLLILKKLRGLFLQVADIALLQQ